MPPAFLIIAGGRPAGGGGVNTCSTHGRESWRRRWANLAVIRHPCQRTRGRVITGLAIPLKRALEPVNAAGRPYAAPNVRYWGNNGQRWLLARDGFVR